MIRLTTISLFLLACSSAPALPDQGPPDLFVAAELPCGALGHDCCQFGQCAAPYQCVTCIEHGMTGDAKCQDPNCGTPGQGCCWHFNTSTCGASEYCAIGVCGDHMCVTK